MIQFAKRRRATRHAFTNREFVERSLKVRFLGLALIGLLTMIPACRGGRRPGIAGIPHGLQPSVQSTHVRLSDQMGEDCCDVSGDERRDAVGNKMVVIVRPQYYETQWRVLPVTR